MPEGGDALVTVQGDVRHADALDALLARVRPEVIVHLAAIHHIPTVETYRANALDVNVVGTERVLEAAERHGVPRVVLATSGAVYDTIDGPLSEDTSPLVAHDNYALSKLTNERQVAFWAHRTGGHALLARLFNTIGPGDPNGHLVPDITGQVPAGAASAVVRLGNTSPERDYIFVEDVAAAFARLATVEVVQPVEAINVCTGVEYSVLDVVAAVGAALGCELSVEVDPARVRRVDRPHQLGDPTRARSRLGWSASTLFGDAVARIVAGS